MVPVLKMLVMSALVLLPSPCASSPLYLQSITLSDMNDSEYTLKNLKFSKNGQEIEGYSMDPDVLGMEYQMDVKTMVVNFHLEPKNFDQIEGTFEILNDVPSKNDAPVVEKFSYKRVEVKRSIDTANFLFHGKAHYKVRSRNKEQIIELFKRVSESGIYNKLDLQWEEFAELETTRDAVNIFTSKGWVEVEGIDYQVTILYSDQKDTFYKTIEDKVDL